MGEYEDIFYFERGWVRGIFYFCLELDELLVLDLDLDFLVLYEVEDFSIIYKTIYYQMT